MLSIALQHIRKMSNNRAFKKGNVKSVFFPQVYKGVYAMLPLVGRTEEKLRSIRPTSRTWWDPFFFSTLKPGTLSLPRSTPAHGGTRSFLYSLSLEPYHFRDPLGLLSFSLYLFSLSERGRWRRAQSGSEPPRRSGDDLSCPSSRPGAGRRGEVVRS